MEIRQFEKTTWRRRVGLEGGAEGGRLQKLGGQTRNLKRILFGENGNPCAKAELMPLQNEKGSHYSFIERRTKKVVLSGSIIKQENRIRHGRLAVSKKRKNKFKIDVLQGKRSLRT